MPVLEAISSSPAATSFISPVGEVIGWVEVLVGGIFGLYLLMFLLNIYRVAATKKAMNEMRRDMRTIEHKIDAISSHMGVQAAPPPSEKKTLGKIAHHIRRIRKNIIKKKDSVKRYKKAQQGAVSKRQ